jgi:N6-L-threonylcarbamoyladenine synthase/protein kinase Bud32
VNHCLAHVEIGRLLTGTKDPITLYVSGGNTIVSAFADKRYRVFGETIDIPIGNALDMFGREAGLQHPGGPKVEVLARKGKKLVELPYIVKGMDLSFSGLVTAAIRKLKEEKEQLEDVCFSLQEYAFSMLVEVTERAIAHTQKKELLLTGGVAQNKRLQEMLGEVAKDQEVAFFTVPKEVAGDNGAMIAWTGILLYKYGKIIDVEKSLVDPKWRLEAVEIPWSME